MLKRFGNFGKQVEIAEIMLHQIIFSYRSGQTEY